MASSSLATLHHPPLWLPTLMILILSLSPSSSLAAEFGRFNKFTRQNTETSTNKDTIPQDSIADIEAQDKDKTSAEVDADGADAQHTFPKDRDEQFRLWNEYQNAKLAAKAAKQTNSETSLGSEEWSKNYQKQKQQFLSDKGNQYKQANGFSPNQLKYGPPQEKENGNGLQGNPYEADSNEDDLDLDNTKLDDTSFPRFQPTKLASQEQSENFYQLNKEEGENGYGQQRNSYKTYSNEDDFDLDNTKLDDSSFPRFQPTKLSPEKRKDLYQPNYEEGVNGYGQQRNSYKTDSNEDDFDLDNTKLDDTSFPRFQPTNLRSQEQNENFNQLNDEDGEKSLDRVRSKTGGYGFGSRQQEQGREGMSDTRFYKNGKFNFDLSTGKYSQNHPYNQIKLDDPNKSVSSVRRNEYPQKYQPENENDLWEDDELEP